MGCDIHIWAETRNKYSQEWEKVGKIFKDSSYDPQRENQVLDNGWESNPPYTDEPFSMRSYNLFAILADVRNGRGFAGVKTGEGFNPISQPKGIPGDISEDILKKYCYLIGHDDDEDTVTYPSAERWVEDGMSEWIIPGQVVSNPDWHSASFLTVRELMDYDWDQISMRRGCITFQQYQECEEKNVRPQEWIAGMWGENVTIIDEDKAEQYLQTGLPEKFQLQEVYVNYHWTSTYRESIPSYWFEEALAKLQSLGEPEDVRVVFWFDN